jgi:hypothetical protein
VAFAARFGKLARLFLPKSRCISLFARMKKSFLTFLVACVGGVVLAGTPISYPKEEAAFTVSFPEGKEEARIAGKENKLIWWSKVGYNVLVSPSKATSAEEMKKAAVDAVTAHATGMSAKEIKAGEPTEKDGKVFVTAECKQEWDGKMESFSATAVVFEAGGKYFQLVSLSKADVAKQRDADIAEIVASIKPAGGSEE